MKSVFIYLIAILIFTGYANAQEKFFTKSGKISFYSKAPLEDIEAVNKTTIAIIDIQTGDIQFSVSMKGFEFKKALMQEHFNENYLESDKYPKSDFKGTIVNAGEIDFKKKGTYNAKTKGKLTIHGVTKDVEADGQITVNESNLALNAVFNISLQDYKIKNDKINNISNTVKVMIDCSMEPLR